MRFRKRAALLGLVPLALAAAALAGQSSGHRRATGAAVIKCVAGSGGGTADLRINEFMTGSTGAASNEFVELVNTSTAAADISGYKLAYRSGTSTSDVTLATIPSGRTVPAGGFY